MVDYKAETQTWWYSPLGQAVTAAEITAIHRNAALLVGDIQVQIGAVQNLLPPREGVRQIYINGGLHSQVCAENTVLPLKTRQIDVLVLAHQLETSADPHQFLREAERVLTAEGLLVVCSFNPWSLWGLRRAVSWRKTMPWQGRFFGPRRQRDWLKLLGFEVLAVEKIGCSLPCLSPRWQRKRAMVERWGQCGWWPNAGVNIIIARRQTTPLTPLFDRANLRVMMTAKALAKTVENKEVDNG